MMREQKPAQTKSQKAINALKGCKVQRTLLGVYGNPFTSHQAIPSVRA